MTALRFARREDAGTLAEIYRPYVENTAVSFETEAPSPAEFQRRIAAYSERFPYLVIEEDGVVLGYAYAHAFHERTAYDWTVETSIYVAEAARGRGLGRTLYTALLELLTLQGIRNACAVVTIPNEPSLRFHRDMGFKEGGILPDFGYKQGQWRAVAYLYRRLGTRTTPPEAVIPVGSLPENVVQTLFQSTVS